MDSRWIALAICNRMEGDVELVKESGGMSLKLPQEHTLGVGQEYFRFIQYSLKKNNLRIIKNTENYNKIIEVIGNDGQLVRNLISY